MMQDKIFISYSHDDSKWAQKFAEELKKLGLNIWFDQFNVGLGNVWADAIETGLKESQIVVILFRSKDVEAAGLSNANLFLEYGAALSMGKVIVPVVPDGIDQSKLPSALRLVRGVPRTTPEETAKQFADALAVFSRKAA